MDDRGLFLTMQAIRRQLAAMPNELYLVRLIHNATRRAVPGERLWTAARLASLATVRFLRARNRQGCDIYVWPYAEGRNSGYILVDLDRAEPHRIEAMRANGHDPCAVVETSPGHLQAWIRVYAAPLEPPVATAVGRRLAQAYGGDPASTDWRHLGRLAGFTNQKPARRLPNGFAPWVKLIHAHPGLASQAEALFAPLTPLSPPLPPVSDAGPLPDQDEHRPGLGGEDAEARRIYAACLQQWRIRERFPQTDWSIVDLWVARHLLSQSTPPQRVQQILHAASPSFPRAHGDPHDYLRRTLAYAAAFPFPRAARPLCGAHAAVSPVRLPALHR